MAVNPYSVEPKRSSAWLWQALTGAALLPLLGLHIIANHFVAKGGLRDYAAVASYLHHPVILGLETLFLVVVTTHALLGVRAIAMDFGLSDRTGRRLGRSLAVVGLLTVGYGLVLTWIIILS
jgi:succinate dehydrogenase hydrophobic anchor subunit